MIIFSHSWLYNIFNFLLPSSIEIKAKVFLSFMLSLLSLKRDLLQEQSSF